MDNMNQNRFNRGNRSARPRIEPVRVRVLESDLTDAGRMLLDAARRQSWLFEAALTPRQGVVRVQLSCTGNQYLDNECDCDDTFRVRVDDLLTWSERARLFGMDGMSRDRWSGKMALRGPIPTEAYIEDVVRMSGGDHKGHGTSWRVPFAIVAQVQRGTLQGADAINAAAEELREYCETGYFRVRGMTPGNGAPQTGL
ncbi:MAG: hypothetical protein ABI670_09035 [Chloroflexota bacterium]